MMRGEALWIGDQLACIKPEMLSPLIELGSSTAAYRREIQPYIEAELHQPLRARGVQVVHSDAKAGEGVDIAGDIHDPQVEAKLRTLGARCLLCCNMFEHVADRAELARSCDRLLAPGGFLVVTVPNSFPLHLDPIDTYYRPSPEEIAEMFPGYLQVASKMIEGGTYLSSIISEGVVAPAIKLVGRLVIFTGARRWRARNHGLLWLWRSYKVAGVVLRKPVS